MYKEVLGVTGLAVLAISNMWFRLKNSNNKLKEMENNIK